MHARQCTDSGEDTCATTHGFKHTSNHAHTSACTHANAQTQAKTRAQPPMASSTPAITLTHPHADTPMHRLRRRHVRNHPWLQAHQQSRSHIRMQTRQCTDSGEDTCATTHGFKHTSNHAHTSAC